MFTALDTLERLTNRNLIRLCSLQFAQETLANLKARLPKGAAEVLLPGAERAVAALERLQDGFFVRRHTASPDIEWHRPDGSIAHLSPPVAAARYIKILRDATHGHGSNRAGQAAETNALLAHHDGDIPHDLGLLGYLYLVDLMNNPDRLRATLYRHGQT